MNTNQSLRSTGVRARPRMAAAQEALLLEELTGFLPDLREQIRASLATNPEDDQGEVDDPLLGELIEQFAQESGAADSTKLKTEIETEFRSSGIAAGIAEAVLAEEMAHTNTELIRHWFACILHAWELWGKNQGELVLGEGGSLLPERNTCPEAKRKAWDNFHDASKAGLSDAIALDENGRRRAREGFVANLRQALDGGPLALPRSLVLMKNGNRVRIVERR